MKKSPIFLITTFLLSSVILYILINIFCYNVSTNNSLSINNALSAVVLYITIMSFINKTSKAPLINFYAMLLPLIAILYIATKDMATDSDSNDASASSIHYLITYLCTLAIFFSYGHERLFKKVILGTIYSLLSIPILLITLFSITFGDFSKKTVVKSEMSPNSIYLAEIIDNDQGALGGMTYVTVTRLNRDLNILIGMLKKRRTVIYSGEWVDFKGMTLKWKTDETLYINEKEYKIN